MLSVDKIIEVWQKELKKGSEELVMATLQGTQIENETYEVQLNIPAPLGKAIERACKLTDSNFDAILSQMVSHGFQTSIQEKLQQPQQALPSAPTEEVTPENLGGQLQGLTNIFEQLQKMQGIMASAKECLNGRADDDSLDSVGQNK